MSIPNTFRPLCGEPAGYVQDGLELYVDCLASTRAELFDVVSGRSIPNAYGTLAKMDDASIRVTGGKGVVPWPDNVARVTEPTLEIVARPVTSAPYGLVVTPFAGVLSTRDKYCAVNINTVITRNETGLRVNLSEELTGVIHVSFVSNEQIWLDSQLRADTEAATSSYAASETQSLLSLFWTTQNQTWDIFAIRYYVRKLNATEIARNYNMDKTRYGL